MIPLEGAERRTLILLAAGRSLAEIARTGGVKRATISSYRARILRKTGATTIPQAWMVAEKAGHVLRSELIAVSPDIVAAQRDDAEARIARALAAFDAGNPRRARAELRRTAPRNCIHPAVHAEEDGKDVRCGLCGETTAYGSLRVPAVESWVVQCRFCDAEPGRPCTGFSGRKSTQVHAVRMRDYQASS